MLVIVVSCAEGTSARDSAGSGSPTAAFFQFADKPRIPFDIDADSELPAKPLTDYQHPPYVSPVAAPLTAEEFKGPASPGDIL
jgi:hypothetical protein